MKIYFLLLFLLFIGCENQVDKKLEVKKSDVISKVDVDEVVKDTVDIKLFNEFVSKFKEVDLPITLDKEFLSSNLINKRDKIESIHFQFLLGLLFVDFNGDNPYDYYVEMKFNISNSKIGLIIKQYGLAGGFEDRYFLFIYTDNGELLSNEIISEYTADCSMLNITSCEISKQLEIFLHSKEYYGECLAGDSLGLVNEYSKTYFINKKTGIIE